MVTTSRSAAGQRPAATSGDGRPGSGLRIRNLSKTFAARGRPETRALDKIDLTVDHGEFLAIVGPSGCGKTTLLRIIAGLTSPTQGEVLLNDEVVRAPRRDVGIMFQTPTLLPWRKVIDNCLLPLQVHGRVDQAARERALNLLAGVGLKGFEDRYPRELSGGMQQRVAICRALVSDPTMLLLDEPFGALDAMTREQMNLDLHTVCSTRQVTTVLITHSISEAVFLAHRVAVMSPRPGRIIDLVEVPLPASRDLSMMDTEEFTHTCARIRSHFQHAHGKAGTDD